MLPITSNISLTMKERPSPLLEYSSTTIPTSNLNVHPLVTRECRV